MKKLVYSLLVLCSAGLLAWACNSMDESVAVTDLEESFNLKAPNGTLLAKSAAALKVFISDGFDISDAEFEITNIDYKKAIRGYLAEITCLLPNGEVKPVLITDWVLDSDGKLVPPTIERIKTKEYERLGEKTVGVIICKKENKYVIEYCTNPNIFITIYQPI